MVRLMYMICMCLVFHTLLHAQWYRVLQPHSPYHNYVVELLGTPYQVWGVPSVWNDPLHFSREAVDHDHAPHCVLMYRQLYPPRCGTVYVVQAPDGKVCVHESWLEKLTYLYSQ